MNVERKKTNLERKNNESRKPLSLFNARLKHSLIHNIAFFSPNVQIASQLKYEKNEMKLKLKLKIKRENFCIRIKYNLKC